MNFWPQKALFTNQACLLYQFKKKKKVDRSQNQKERREKAIKQLNSYTDT